MKVGKYRILAVFIFTVMCCAMLLCHGARIAGDMDRNYVISSNDAIFLLRHTFNPEKYPILENGDVNSDGKVNSDDAIYLLRHTLDAQKYPILSVVKEDFTISVSEDAYVLNQDDDGEKYNYNFGVENEIFLKSNNGKLTRYGYVKFDISELAEDEDFTCIELDLSLTSRQSNTVVNDYASAAVYGCDTLWSEDGITFANQPDMYGFVDSKDIIERTNKVCSFTVTDYVKQALIRGETEVAFCLVDCTEEKPLHIRFASKESGGKNLQSCRCIIRLKSTIRNTTSIKATHKCPKRVLIEFWVLERLCKKLFRLPRTPTLRREHRQLQISVNLKSLILRLSPGQLPLITEYRF